MDTNERKYEYTLKLSGKASIPAALEIGHNYTIRISGSITSKTEADSEGEEILIYYKFVPVFIEIITPTGETMRAKDTRSRSQQMRMLLMKRWRESDSSKTFDEYYDERMVTLMGEII